MTVGQLQKIREEFQGNQLVCEQVAGLFHLLSNKVRFRIVCTLLSGDACVQDIADVIGDGCGKMSNISQQLRMLRLSGVVARRREKKNIIYSLADERVARLIRYLRNEFLEESPITT